MNGIKISELDTTDSVANDDLFVIEKSNDTKSISYKNVFRKVNEEISGLHDKMNEVFQSVSNGKMLVATAITDKGVETVATASFSTMANNIRDIPSGDENAWKSEYVECRPGILEVISEYVEIEKRE